MPDQLPDVTEIRAALGIGKVNFEVSRASSVHRRMTIGNV